MIFLFLLLTTLLFSSPQFGGACGCEDKPQVNILAVVDGVKITKQDLGGNAQNRISALQDEVIKARSAELDLQINNLVLEAEAKRRDTTPAKLLQVELAARVPEPTEAEAEAFYNQNKERITQDFKSVKGTIIDLLRSERRRFETAKFALELRATANIKILENVTPPANERDLNRIFARVNGRNITSRDIETSLRPLILRVQEQVYAARKEDLDLKINDMLLQQEAKKHSTTPAALIAGEVKAKLPIITDQQAKAFYDENKARINGDFDQLKFQIIQYLTQREEQRLSLAFATQLRQNAAVQIYLTPPERPK